MGNTYQKRSGPPNREPRDLTNRPFKAAFKGMRVGPTCLACSGPLDARPGWSLSNPKGSRKAQRHGYLHPDCELKAVEETAKRQGKVAPQKDGTLKVLPGVKLELPVYSEEELEEILRSKETRS